MDNNKDKNLLITIMLNEKCNRSIKRFNIKGEGK